MHTFELILGMLATDAVAYNRGKAHFISGVIGDRS